MQEPASAEAAPASGKQRASWLQPVRVKRLPAYLLAVSCVLLAVHLLMPDASRSGLKSETWPRLHGDAAGTFSSLGQHFYNAYYDTRSSLGGRRLVRIFAILDEKFYSGHFRCRFFDDKGRSSFTAEAAKAAMGSGIYGLRQQVRAYQHSELGEDEHGYREFQLDCEIRGTLSAASFVVVESASGKYRSPVIKVSHNPQSSGAATPQKLIVNCVSLTFGEPSEHRLIEWLEAQRLLGMDKVVLHLYHVTSRRFEEVAAAYEKEGFVDIRRMACPFCVEGKENWLGLLLMSPAINQCLYENLGRYQFTAVFDLDEIIVPQQHANYSSMLQSLAAKGERRSFVFRNWYHFSELGDLPQVPRHLHMLRHPYRTKKCSPPGYSVKSIHTSKYVVALHNHYSWASTPGAPGIFDASTDIGINQHFKKCHFTKAQCAPLINRTQRAVGDRLNRLMAGRLKEAVQRRMQQLSLPPVGKV